MLVRGLEALSLAVTRGSAFTKNRRPSSSTTLAIWPLAPLANKVAKKIAQKTSVVRMSHVVIAVRFIIRLLPDPVQFASFGRKTTIFEAILQRVQLSTLPRSGQCPFGTSAPAERSTLKGGGRAMVRLENPCPRATCQPLCGRI